MSPVSHNFRKPFGSPPAEISDHMQRFKKDISCESDFFSLARADRSGTGTSVCGTQPQSLSFFFRDLCTAFGKDVLKLVEARPMIHELLTEGRRSKTNKTKTLATWATKELRKLKNQAW